MDNCVFCKIIDKIKKKDYSQIWLAYEDSNYIVILPKESHAWGHVLVIPKTHVRWCWDVDDPKFWQLSNKMAKVLTKTYNCKFILGIQHGIGVSHAHNHLIPRFDGDGHNDVLNEKVIFTYSPKEKDKILSEIKQNI